MKTKTTLAALLLAAVMVTPSYGATKTFLDGTSAEIKEKAQYDSGYFMGFCRGVAESGKIEFPVDAKYGQLYRVVARYVLLHPEHHHLSNVELVKRACKEAWPDLNKHVFISR